MPPSSGLKTETVVFISATVQLRDNVRNVVMFVPNDMA